MLVAEDTVDTFHTWDASNPNWIETFWFGAWIPEIVTTVYIYQWFRPVIGIYGGGCFIWDDSAYLPWDIPVFHYDVNRPITGPTDLRTLSLESGTTLKTVEEGHVYDIGFVRGETEVAMRFDAVTPPEIVADKGVSEFFNGHIDQAGRYTGYLRTAGKEHKIDCFGIRDRSWGPRVITNDIRLNYCHGQSERLAFVCYSKPDGSTDSVFKGYLSIDGVSHELTTGQRRTRYDDGVLLDIQVDLTDAQGRHVKGTGTPLNRMVYEPYPGLVNWLYLMRWQFGSDVIYGEEQDVWSIPLWHKRDPSRRIRGRA
jgi:hypothetical protein